MWGYGYGGCGGGYSYGGGGGLGSTFVLIVVLFILLRMDIKYNTLEKLFSSKMSSELSMAERITDSKRGRWKVEAELYQVISSM